MPKTTKKAAKTAQKKAFSMIEINKRKLTNQADPGANAERVRSFISEETTTFESGIEIPPETPMDRNIRRDAYPLGKLEPMQSFSYPLVHGSEKQKRQRTAIVNAIRKHCEKYPQQQFVFRMLANEGVIRVWRIADVKPGK